MTAIISKEIRSFFSSMLGYAFLAFYLVVVGIYFYIYNLVYCVTDFHYVLQGVSMFFIFLIPVLTIRAMAEESKNKTDQLLLTSPISVEKIVIGKYIGIFCVYVIAMVITMIYPLIISKYAQEGTMNFAQSYYAILGFTLLGATYLAIGVFISSLTESLVLSTVLTSVTILLTVLMSSLSSKLPSGNKETWWILAGLFLILAIILNVLVKNLFVSVTFGILSEAILAILYIVKPSVYDNTIAHIVKVIVVSEPFDNFTSGNMNLSDIVYYLSIIFVFLFLTVQVIKKKRWN